MWSVATINYNKESIWKSAVDIWKWFEKTSAEVIHVLSENPTEWTKQIKHESAKANQVVFDTREVWVAAQAAWIRNKAQPWSSVDWNPSKFQNDEMVIWHAHGNNENTMISDADAKTAIELHKQYWVENFMIESNITVWPETLRFIRFHDKNSNFVNINVWPYKAWGVLVRPDGSVDPVSKYIKATQEKDFGSPPWLVAWAMARQMQAQWYDMQKIVTAYRKHRTDHVACVQELYALKQSRSDIAESADVEWDTQQDGNVAPWWSQFKWAWSDIWGEWIPGAWNIESSPMPWRSR